MSQDDSTHFLVEETRELIDRLIDGNLSEADRTRLERLVIENPAAADLYLDYMLLQAAVQTHSAAQAQEQILCQLRAEDAASIRPGSYPKIAAAATSVRQSNDSAPQATSVPSPKPAQRRKGRLLGQRDWKIRGLAAAVAILAASVVWIIFGTNWSKPQIVEIPHSSTPRNMEDATVRPVQLETGFTRLTLDGNVQVLIQGPAEYSIVSSNLIRLNVGKLTAVVPHSVTGFTVITKEASITDLGTEFAVEAGERYTKSEVFEGRIAVTPITGQSPVKQILSAGQADRVYGGQVFPEEPSPEMYVRVSDYDNRHAAETRDTGAFERWLAFSREMRRDPSLVLYYTLDDEQPGSFSRLRNHAETTTGRYDLPLDGFSAPTTSAGRWPGHGAALDFDPVRRQRLLLENYPAAKDGRLTVFAWVYARSRPIYANIVNNWWGTRYGQYHLGFWGPEKDGDLWAMTSPTDKSTPKSNVSARERSPFPIGRWCQVALVVDGEMLRLYRDGALVAATPSPGLNPQPAATTLGIGFKPGDDGEAPSNAVDSGFWNGKIDELAVFHRALSPAEIRESYLAGMPLE